MKKIFAICIVLALLLCLTSCDFSNDKEDEEEKTKKQQELSQCMEIWTDEETGVQYIIYRSGSYGGVGGITPRFNADGTLYTVNNAE